MDVGTTSPWVVDCGFFRLTRLAMASYSSEWWDFLWAQRLLVDCEDPILAIANVGLQGFEHAKHMTCSEYRFGCWLGTKSSKPSHHKDCFLPETGMVKYLVTANVLSLPYSLSSWSRSVIWVAWSKESLALRAGTFFNWLAKLASEISGCCFFLRSTAAVRGTLALLYGSTATTLVGD